jgi:hypothetical protein
MIAFGPNSCVKGKEGKEGQTTMKRSIKLNMAMVIFAGILAEGLAIRNGDAGRRGIGARIVKISEPFLFQALAGALPPCEIGEMI